MPPRFYARTRTMKRCAVSDLICTVILIMALGLAVELLVLHGSSLAISIAMATALTCMVLLVRNARRIKALSKPLTPYCVPLDDVTFSAIVSGFDAAEVESGGYAAFSKLGKYSVRLLIQHTHRFDHGELCQQRKKLNRKNNAHYKTKTEMPIFEALSMLRINLVVCDEAPDDVWEYLEKNIELLLSRNELIVPAVIALDRQQLFFPNCMASLTINQLARYVAAARYLCSALPVSNEAQAI